MKLSTSPNKKSVRFKSSIIALLVFAAVLIIAINHKGKSILDRINEEPERIITDERPGDDIPLISLKSAFYDGQLFLKSVSNAKKTGLRDDIFAVIVPHHLLASDFIASELKSASGRKINTVAIIGPNHLNKGGNTISSALAEWQTPYGLLEENRGFVQKIRQDLNISADEKIFEDEHSIGAMAPYVKYYFPTAKIIPVIFTSNAKSADAEKVSRWLLENLPDDSLVILSADFSHYLTKQAAEEKDGITRKYILDKNMDKITLLNNDYIDSPIGLATILMYADGEKLKTEFTGHANSYDLSLEKPEETTSYFAISFSRIK